MKNTYAMSYVCLECCKSFKRPLKSAARDPETMVCPNCDGTAYNYGRHFKPPKTKDKKQWDKIRYLFRHGFRFQKIRPVKNSLESIPYPETIKEAEEFVIKYSKFSVDKWKNT